MTIEDQLGWVIDSVESIHMYQLVGVGSIDGSEVLTSVTELDLLAGSEWNYLPIMLDLVVVDTYVHESQSIAQADNDMESRWVE